MLRDVALLLALARVDHVFYAWDRDRRLGDVRREDALAHPRRRRGEHLRLLRGREGGVDGAEEHLWGGGGQVCVYYRPQRVSMDTEREHLPVEEFVFGELWVC